MKSSKRRTGNLPAAAKTTPTNDDHINVQKANAERSAIKEYFEVNIPEAFPNSKYGYDETLEDFKKALNFLLTN